MPYKSNQELPKGVRSLPAAAQTIFRKAFNDIMYGENPPSEERGFKMAWGAVHNAGWSKDEEGEWVHDSALDAWEESKHPRDNEGQFSSGGRPATGGVQSGPSAEYKGAMEKFRSISAKFREAQAAYRARKIGDDEYLKARKEFEAAQKEADLAEADEDRRPITGTAVNPPRRTAVNPQPQLPYLGSAATNEDDETRRRRGHDSVEVHEMIALDAGAKVRKTKDGYLVAQPRVARSGIQVYKGREVGRPEMDEVRVYRPEDEVFDKKAMTSFARLPVTLEHPPVLVDASNWKKYAVGQGDAEVIRDGQFIRVPIMVTDAAAVKAYDRGKVELSAGYTMDLTWETGKTESGEAYDAVQREIRGNHIALVDTARGGSQLRIGDEGDVKMKTVVVDGLEVEMPEMAAKVVTRCLDNFADMIEEKKKKAKKDEEEKAEYDSKLTDSKKQIEAKDAEIATLKQQLKDAEVTPARLDTLVKDRATVIGKAKAILGDKLVVEGKSVDEMRKQTVDARLGAAAKDWTVDQVRASFDSLAAQAPQQSRTQLDAALSDGIQTQHAVGDASEKAYDEYINRLENAWKQPVAQPPQ